jgi:hypothetical protein
MANCLFRSGLLLALSMGLMATPSRAQAPQRERIALHPCVITGGKKANTPELETTCATAAVRESMNLVPSTEVRAFLEKERGSCARAKNRNSCLGRLAAATQASRVLYITLNPFTPKSTRITGLVVDETGTKVEEKSLELPRIANQPPRDVVRFSVSQLLDQLDVARAPAQDSLPVPLTPDITPEPPAVAAPSPTPEPAPSATPAPQPPAPVASIRQEGSSERTWKTPAGIAGIAVGGVGIVASGFLLSKGNSKAKDFNGAFDGRLPAQSDLPGLIAQRDEAKSQQTLATITGISSVALGLGGAALLWLDRPSSPGDSSPDKAGTARLLAGPGQVGVLVLLP